MTAAIRGPATRRLLTWLAALAIIAFVVTFGVGHLQGSIARTSPSIGVTRDPAVGFGRDHGTDTLEVRSLHSQPASRTRGSMLAVLAIGIVVAALARRERLVGEYAVVPRFRLASLRSGRGPPLARIA